LALFVAAGSAKFSNFIQTGGKYLDPVWRPAETDIKARKVLLQSEPVAERSAVLGRHRVLPFLPLDLGFHFGRHGQKSSKLTKLCRFVPVID
jgi:hypothetical protein